MSLILRVLAALCLVFSVGCSEDSGGDVADTTVTTTATDTSEADSTADSSTADSSTADSNTADSNTADSSTADSSTADSSTADTGTDPCGNGVCESDLGEDETTCLADCEPLAACAMIGEPCDESTLDGPNPGRPEGLGTLTCVRGYDSLDLDLAVCLPTCFPMLGSFDCDQGSFCLELDEDVAACVPANCSSPLQSASECAAAGDNGGTCFEFDYDELYCVAAGPAANGAACTENVDCGPDLYCFEGTCSETCAVTGVPPRCGTNRVCLDVLDSNVVGVCVDACSGFGAEPSECGAGVRCLPTEADSGQCRAAGAVAVGGACASSGDCLPGALCESLNTGDPGTCRAICDQRDGFGDETCASSEVCRSVNGVAGVCFDGCTPFVAEVDNGCTEAGQRGCLPLEDQTRGICVSSGDKTEGMACSVADGSVFGDCRGDLACRTSTSSSTTGECVKLCRTFSSVNDYVSGCGQDDVCEVVGREWGLCGADTDVNAPLAALDTCDTPVAWCGDDLQCLPIGADGTNICVPMCRIGTDDDCPFEPSTCIPLFADTGIGACAPAQ
ncbi:MAG: hypothetical protein ACI9MR_001022 [Myxococcota bacterium]|jgi:hypothetical protein